MEREQEGVDGFQIDPSDGKSVEGGERWNFW